MASLVIEAGVYLLLVFTPFAFGGVELWAIGVVQIITGIVFVAWVWQGQQGDPQAREITTRLPRGILALWIPIGLFLALVLLQVVPLPGSLLERLSPAVHGLYVEAIPGYGEGRALDPSELPSWLLAQMEGRLPGSDDTSWDRAALSPPLDAVENPTRISPRRSLSVNPHATRQMLSLLLCFAALFAVVTTHYRTRRRLVRLVAACVFSGFAVSLVGVIQRVGTNDKLLFIREVRYREIFGPFVNRNNYAGFAATVLPLAVCMALAALQHRRDGKRDALPHLLLWGFAAVTLTGGIFLSLSRGGILSAAFSMLVVTALVLYRGGRKAEMSILAALVVASLAFLVWIGPEQVVERVGTLSEGPEISSLAHRVGAWERSLEMVADHAAFGSGLGTFRWGFMRYAPPGEAWWMLADNAYVELVCDTGLTGGMIFLVGLGMYLYQVFKRGRLEGAAELHTHTGMLAGLLAALFGSIASSNLQYPANGLMAVIVGAGLLGFVSADNRRRRAGNRPTMVAVPRPPLTSAGTAKDGA